MGERDDLTWREAASKMADRDMSVDSPSPVSASRLRAAAAKSWRAALWLIFGLILMIPKINRLRRHARAWNFGRVVAGLAAVAMIAAGVGWKHSAGLAFAGAVELLVALVLRPERREVSIDARAKELGALIVVDGGNYRSGAATPIAARLFIGAERLWILGPDLRILSEIELPQIETVSLKPIGADWKLGLHGAGAAAEFLYQGNFAEHLARVAEATLRSRLYRELPVVH